MSDSPSRDFTPWFIEFFALACAFGCIDSIRGHNGYTQDISFAVASLMLAAIGFNWLWIKTRVTALAKSRKLRTALAENADLRKQLEERTLSSLPAQNSLVKPQHNVQCVGFKAISDPPFTIAAMIFRNVPNGKLLGKFQFPLLRVIYYDNSTGLEIADLCPLLWWGLYEDAPAEIDASESYAQIAFHFEKGWKAYELNKPQEDDLFPKEKINSVDLPAGTFRIIAMLSGEYRSLSIPQVTGILTLGEDGAASFQRTSD
ncbi:MAG TPA: hypothetical protein VHX63_11315 [Acidobacteriaceae bacterium]|jgi:hypothetical protein|nr:hypothetical protein [Acidobacteriaceae bacterium]